MNFNTVLDDNTEVTILRIRTPVCKEDEYDCVNLNQDDIKYKNNIYDHIFLIFGIICFILGFIKFFDLYTIKY
jgi:hypothetical protein